MKAKTLTIVALAALLAGTAAAQSGPATNLDAILVQTDPIPVQSGEDAEVIFKVVNHGNAEAEDVTVSIVDSFPFRLQPDRKRNYSLGTVHPGEAYYITTQVLVADDAPDGENPLRAQISHGDFSRTAKIPVTVQSQDIELNLANLQTAPPQLTPGTEDAKLTVELVNNGEKTAENVVVNLALPDSFEKLSSFSTRQALGNLEAGEVKTASFNFDVSENASSGDIFIPVNLSYNAGDSNTAITEETGFEFFLAGRPQFVVTGVESQLSAGSTGEIRITVKNTGSETSSSTRVRVLDSSDMPFDYGSASQYVGTLEPGQSGTVVFDTTVESSAEVKQYLVDFTVRGVKDTQVYVEDETVEVTVDQGERGSSLPLLPVAIVLLAGTALYYFRSEILERLR